MILHTTTKLMKTKIPHLILALSLSLFAAQPASAALVFTFSDGGTGFTTITTSGDTATAAGSGGANTSDQIGFSASGSGSVRQTGFKVRTDAFPATGGYGTFASLGSGSFADTITLASTGIAGGLTATTTEISGFQFSSSNFNLIMTGLANNGDTISFAGASDVVGSMAIDYSAFATLHGQTVSNTSDGFDFVFAAVPEPSSAALLGLGGLALILRRRK